MPLSGRRPGAARRSRPGRARALGALLGVGVAALLTCVGVTGAAAAPVGVPPAGSPSGTVVAWGNDVDGQATVPGGLTGVTASDGAEGNTRSSLGPIRPVSSRVKLLKNWSARDLAVESISRAPSWAILPPTWAWTA